MQCKNTRKEESLCLISIGLRFNEMQVKKISITIQINLLKLNLFFKYSASQTIYHQTPTEDHKFDIHNFYILKNLK